MPAPDHGLPQPGKDRAQAGLTLWISVVILGVNWPVMKLGLEAVSPMWMAALRFALTLPFALAFALLANGRLPRLDRGDLPVILGVALLQFVAQMVLMTLALQRVAAGTASILVYTTPLWLTLVDWILSGRPPARRRALSTLLSTLGCLAVVVASGIAQALPLGLILLASLCWSLSIRLVAWHRWRGEVSDALFWQWTLAAAILLPLAFLAEGPPAATALSWRGIACLLFIGPVASGLGFGLMIYAGRHLSAPRVTLTSTAAPVIGYLSSTLILAEPLRPAIILGGALILAAIATGIARPARPGVAQDMGRV